MLVVLVVVVTSATRSRWREQLLLFVSPSGGAILVGRLKSNGDAPAKQVALEAGPVLATPLGCKEAWPEVDATHVTPRVSSPVHESAGLNEVTSPPPPPALAPPPPVLATPPHCIQGSLRKADFQHNGEAAARQPPGGRWWCGSSGPGPGPGSGSGPGPCPGPGPGPGLMLCLLR